MEFSRRKPGPVRGGLASSETSLREGLERECSDSSWALLGIGRSKLMAQKPEQASISKALEVASLAAGCFWCTEAVFDQLKGVVKVESGYSGGNVPNPSYEQVCTGDTGHAESIEITFDPSIISFKDLLQIFFTTHDPTTYNRQGGDVGTQYRSAVFYHNPEQEKIARQVIQEFNEWGAPTSKVSLKQPRRLSARSPCSVRVIGNVQADANRLALDLQGPRESVPAVTSS